MRTPNGAATRLAVRQTRIGIGVLALVIAGSLASVVATYEQMALAGGSLVELAKSPALRLLYGEPTGLDTGGGFAVWRSGQAVLVIVGLWAIFATTRMLRGEEEHGRWELLLGGIVTRDRLMGASTGVLLAGSAVAGLAVTAALAGSGAAAGGASVFGTGVALLGMTFVGVGAVGSQLFGTRRQAAGTSAALLGALFALRMAGEASDALSWLRWLTPFGWVEQLRPFVLNRWWPLLLLAAAAALLLVAAVALQSRRDLSSAILRDRDRAEPRTRLLRSPLGIAWRERVASIAGWGAALAATGLLMGGLAKTMVDFLRGNAQLAETFERFGLTEAATVKGFIGGVGTFIAVVLAFYCVASLHAMWEDEQGGRLEHVFVASVTRLRWLGSQAAATLGGLLVLALAYTVGVWAGVRATGLPLSVGDAAMSSLNMIPVALVFAGISILVIGSRPELQMALAGGAVALSMLLSMIGPITGLPGWIIDLSPMRHLAPAPAVPIDTAASLVMVVVAVAAAAAGAAAYRARDLR